MRHLNPDQLFQSQSEHFEIAVAIECEILHRSNVDC